MLGARLYALGQLLRRYPDRRPLAHAQEELWELAKALFPHHQPTLDSWVHARLDALLATLCTHADSCEPARKCAHYIDTNRDRMRYREFRSQQMCLGSGVVESGCRTAVGRLKQSGMYWTVDGANDIPALRCCVLSGNYEDFWAQRVENR